LRPDEEMTKLILGVFIGLMVALGAGWVWGTSGKGQLDRARQAAELRAELLAGRAAVLDARLDVCSVNFGEASRHLESARALVLQAQEDLKSADRPDAATQLDDALTNITEAQRLAGQLNQDANARAADAAKTISAVLDSEAPR
jgi:hypothetical protein